jgi:hypothetical protein
MSAALAKPPVESPPLPGVDERTKLRSEHDESLSIEIERGAATRRFRGVQHAGGVKPRVDQQDHHGGEARVRDSGHLAGRASIDCAGADFGVAVGANFIGGRDEGPAIRAHAAFIHWGPL